jgi:hypothetical protein
MDKYLAPYEGYLDPENVNFGNMDQEEAMFISYIQDIQQYLIDVNGSYQFSKVVFSELFGQNSN